MPAVAIVLGVVTAARTAHADTQLTLGDAIQLDPALGSDRLRDLMGDDQPSDPWLLGETYAQVVVGDHGAGIGIGGSVHVSGANCEFLDASAHAVFDNTHVAGDASYRVCLLNAGIRFVLGGGAGAGLAPELAARRSLWNRRYDLTTQHIELGLGELSLHGRNRHLAFLIEADHEVTTQTDGFDTQQTVSIPFAISLYRLRRLALPAPGEDAPRSELQLDVFRFETTAVKAGLTNAGGVALSIYPVALSTDAGAWFASARGGVGYLGGSTTQSTSTTVNGEVVSMHTDTVTSAGLPQVQRYVGDATVGVRRDQVTTSATLSRAVFATFDGNEALDTRATATAEVALGKTTIALSAFVARTQTWSRTPVPATTGSARSASALGADSLLEGSPAAASVTALREITTGASVRIDRVLTRHLDLHALGEAGHTPYSRRDGARTGAATDGGQVLVSLRAHRHYRGIHGSIH